MRRGVKDTSTRNHLGGHGNRVWWMQIGAAKEFPPVLQLLPLRPDASNSAPNSAFLLML